MTRSALVARDSRRQYQGNPWPKKRPTIRALLGLICVVVGAGATVGSVRAQAVTLSGPCVGAIAGAAARHDVPFDRLLAISRVESGLRPYVINAAGQGYGFDDRPSAVEGVENLQRGGVDSIDVGCMQINLRWHPDAFTDLNAAFDPAVNADYGARFLRRLFDESGSWVDATQRYHSGDPVRGRRYGCAVDIELARLRGDRPPACRTDGPTIRTAANTFTSAAVLTPNPLSGPAGSVVIHGQAADGSVAVEPPSADDVADDARVVRGFGTDARVIRR